MDQEISQLLVGAGGLGLEPDGGASKKQRHSINQTRELWFLCLGSPVSVKCLPTHPELESVLWQGAGCPPSASVSSLAAV